MKNRISELIESSREAIKYWWLVLIIGISIFVMGIVIFAYPAESYFGMTVAFGWLVLLSGITQIVLYSTNKHTITNSGWMLFGGIIESILGLILIFSISLSTSTLPMFLGFWLLLRSFSMMGFGSDMRSMKIAGGGWTIFTSILLLIAALMILIQPIVFGIEAVIIWVGLSFLFAGISLSLFAFQLRQAHIPFDI